MRFLKAFFLGLACTGFFWQTAQAGFFDDLFGQDRSPQAEPLWQPEDSLQPRQSRRTQPRHRIVNIARHSPPAPPESPAWEVFLDDPTLINGDAVMTPNGLRIFTGSGGWEHNSEDFAKLREVTGLPKAERAKLASIEEQGPETNWRSNSEPELQTGRSAAQAAPAKTIFDREGQAIRYVGP